MDKSVDIARLHEIAEVQLKIAGNNPHEETVHAVRRPPSKTAGWKEHHSKIKKTTPRDKPGVNECTRGHGERDKCPARGKNE